MGLVSRKHIALWWTALTTKAMG